MPSIDQGYVTAYKKLLNKKKGFRDPYKPVMTVFDDDQQKNQLVNGIGLEASDITLEQACMHLEHFVTVEKIRDIDFAVTVTKENLKKFADEQQPHEDYTLEDKLQAIIRACAASIEYRKKVARLKQFKQFIQNHFLDMTDAVGNDVLDQRWRLLADEECRAGTAGEADTDMFFVAEQVVRNANKESLLDNFTRLLNIREEAQRYDMREQARGKIENRAKKFTDFIENKIVSKVINAQRSKLWADDSSGKVLSRFLIQGYSGDKKKLSKAIKHVFVKKHKWFGGVSLASKTFDPGDWMTLLAQGDWTYSERWFWQSKETQQCIVKRRLTDKRLGHRITVAQKAREYLAEFRGTARPESLDRSMLALESLYGQYFLSRKPLANEQNDHTRAAAALNFIGSELKNPGEEQIEAEGVGKLLDPAVKDKVCQHIYNRMYQFLEDVKNDQVDINQLNEFDQAASNNLKVFIKEYSSLGNEYVSRLVINPPKSFDSDRGFDDIMRLLYEILAPLKTTDDEESDDDNDDDDDDAVSEASQESSSNSTLNEGEASFVRRNLQAMFQQNEGAHIMKQVADKFKKIRNQERIDRMVKLLHTGELSGESDEKYYDTLVALREFVENYSEFQDEYKTTICVPEDADAQHSFEELRDELRKWLLMDFEAAQEDDRANIAKVRGMLMAAYPEQQSQLAERKIEILAHTFKSLRQPQATAADAATKGPKAKRSQKAAKSGPDAANDNGLFNGRNRSSRGKKSAANGKRPAGSSLKK